MTALDGSEALSTEQRHIRDVAAQVARERYRPLALEWDDARTPLPIEERRLLGELGFLGIALPERFGGLGLSLHDALLVQAEVAKECRPAAFPIFEANVGPAQAINLLGSEEQRQRFLPAVATGEKTVAVAISEPDAGSAATDMTTHALLDGDDYVINGTKRWISNGGHADQYLLYARFTDAIGSNAIGAIVVDADTPGLTFGAQEQLMGFRGIPSCDLIFEDARVPAKNLIIGPGRFRDLFGSFSVERLGNATMSLAIGQAALDRTVDYVRERMQFGKQIIEFQSVQMMLADMVMEVEASRLLVYRAAHEAQDGLPDPLQVSIAKCTANEMAKRVTDRAIQLHGGNGYSREYGIEALHRDAHGWAIAGGTPAMQRIRIVSQLLGRGFDQRR